MEPTSSILTTLVRQMNNGNYSATALAAEITDLRAEVRRLTEEKERIFRAGAVCSKALREIESLWGTGGGRTIAAAALQQADDILAGKVVDATSFELAIRECKGHGP